MASAALLRRIGAARMVKSLAVNIEATRDDDLEAAHAIFIAAEAIERRAQARLDALVKSVLDVNAVIGGAL